MKTILTCRCECGEDFYEDDVNCCNCNAPIDKSKLKPEPYADITYDGDKMVVDVSDICSLCGADPMTANCNNAGCS